MKIRSRILQCVVGVALAAPLAALAGAQVRAAGGAQPSAFTDKDAPETQEQLLKLLRTSPSFTMAVSADPSLLADQPYVSRSNPELAQFLVTHPDVARNPEYYLFSHLNDRRGRRDLALQRAVWPEYAQAPQRPPMFQSFVNDLAGILAFACFLAALLWFTRQLIESRRWNRIVKLQSEVHGKLIDRFTTSQELAAYMETGAGRRFLEAAPIPIDFETGQRVPVTVARVLTPLQVGIVLVLLGIGFFLLRSVSTEMQIPMLVLGTVSLMPGIGFILSAGASWVLAGRLGLMPEGGAAGKADAAHFNGQDRP